VKYNPGGILWKGHWNRAEWTMAKETSGIAIFEFDCRHYADFVLPESRMINDSQRYNQNLLKKGV